MKALFFIFAIYFLSTPVVKAEEPVPEEKKADQTVPDPALAHGAGDQVIEAELKPAAVQKKIIKKAPVAGPNQWVVKSVSGLSGKKKFQPLRAGAWISQPKKWDFAPGALLKLQRGQEMWQVRFDKKSQALIGASGLDLTVQLLEGSATWSADEHNIALLVVDFGPWRVLKKTGVLKTQGSWQDAQIGNEKGDLWLKKDDLAELAKEIPSPLRFRIQGDSIFDFQDVQVPAQKTVWTLSEGGRGISSDKSSKAKNNSNELCHDPQGEYEQCAWKCMGPLSSEKFCDTTRPGIRCLRFTCSADGGWKLPTFVPGGECLARGTRVGQCQ